jgi:hypothetical protein
VNAVLYFLPMLQFAPTNPATHDVHAVGDVHVMQPDGQIA